VLKEETRGIGVRTAQTGQEGFSILSTFSLEM